MVSSSYTLLDNFQNFFGREGCLDVDAADGFQRCLALEIHIHVERSEQFDKTLLRLADLTREAEGIAEEKANLLVVILRHCREETGIDGGQRLAVFGTEQHLGHELHLVDVVGVVALRSAYTQCLDAHYQYNVTRLSLLRLTGNLDVLTK